MSSAGPDVRRWAIRVPDMGTGDQPLQLVQWLVDRDSEVLSGDRVAEVLASGILFQIASPASGMVAGIEREGRSAVRTGEIIGWIQCESTSSEDPT